MGKLNFKNCNIVYDSSIVSLESNTDVVKIRYNFSNYSENITIVKIFLNTTFIQNLNLKFRTDLKVSLNLELRMGEQNFVYRNISFDLKNSIIIPIEEFNPYSSSIYLIIKNNHNNGLIQIKK